MRLCNEDLSYYHLLWLQGNIPQKVEIFCEIRKPMVGKRLQPCEDHVQPQGIVWKTCHLTTVTRDVVGLHASVQVGESQRKQWARRENLVGCSPGWDRRRSWGEIESGERVRRWHR